MECVELVFVLRKQIIDGVGEDSFQVGQRLGGLCVEVGYRLDVFLLLFGQFGQREISLVEVVELSFGDATGPAGNHKGKDLLVLVEEGSGDVGIDGLSEDCNQVGYPLLHLRRLLAAAQHVLEYPVEVLQRKLIHRLYGRKVSHD